MTYIALARKWRPRTFSELLGQEHLTRALTQSLTQNRVHHAYLFTGTRGVGKTSVARILAKALNCVQGVSALPCLQCDICQAIEQGRFIDLIEIDAASKTRVEDTRELLDNVQYAPTIGRYKVYLIDEVHMLSQHSFNALLKTLEEPPAHVKFLLATTDIQKIPVTILSRCLQFHLKHVSEPIITAHLQTILQSEQVDFEPPALNMIAKAARGSMRDALSLLDQSLAGRTDTLSATNVAGLLGQTTEDYAIQLLQALCTQDPQQLITISRHIAQTGGQFRYVLDELLAYLHRIAVLQALPTTPATAGEQAALCPPYIESQPEIALFAQQLSSEDTQLFYQIGLKGLGDLPFAPTPIIGFEMTLLRMYTFKPAAPAAIPKLAYQQPKSLSLTPDSPSHSKSESQPVSIAPPIVPTLHEPIEPTLHEPIMPTPHEPIEPTLHKPIQPTLHEPIEPTLHEPIIPTPHEPIESTLQEPVVPTPDKAIEPALHEPIMPTPHEPIEPVLHEPASPIVSELSQPKDWATIVTQLQLSGLALSAIQHSEFLNKSAHEIILKVEKSHQSIFTKPVITRIQDSLSAYYQETIRLTLQYQQESLDSPATQKKLADIKQHESFTQALQSDPVFQQLQKEFSADLIKDTVAAT